MAPRGKLVLRMEPASLPGFTPQRDVPLAPLTTFRIGGPARYFASAVSEDDVAEACAWARAQSVPVFVLGGGSNLLVSDRGFDGLVLHIALRGVTSTVEEGRRVFEVSAGENWDEFVSLSVAQDCAGVECLAGIPGSVGGTPVQNVGAYGQEVASTIQSVRCFDQHEGTFVTFSAAECGFRYRESRFNTGPDKGRYVVTRVRFALLPAGKPSLAYADLQRAFARGTRAPSLSEVAEAVRAIRRTKGMVIDPAPPAESEPDSRSAGSFFKNPVVPETLYAQLASAFAPAVVPGYPAPPDDAGQPQRKLAAAWLIEQAGFPHGYACGGAAISSRHTLALTNHSGSATAAEVLRLRDHITEVVRERFGVALSPEPVLLGTMDAPSQSA
jgi:UDP-N-acetylmuramate dehydrogenase